GNREGRLHRPLSSRFYCVMAYLSCQLLFRDRQRTRAARLRSPEHRPIPGIQMQRQGSSSCDRKRSSMEEFLPRHRPRKAGHGSKILYQSGQGQEQTPPGPRSTAYVSSQKGQGVARDSSSGPSSRYTGLQHSRRCARSASPQQEDDNHVPRRYSSSRLADEILQDKTKKHYNRSATRTTHQGDPRFSSHVISLAVSELWLAIEGTLGDDRLRNNNRASKKVEKR